MSVTIVLKVSTAEAAIVCAEDSVSAVPSMLSTVTGPSMPVPVTSWPGRMSAFAAVRVTAVAAVVAVAPTVAVTVSSRVTTGVVKSPELSTTLPLKTAVASFVLGSMKLGGLPIGGCLYRSSSTPAVLSATTLLVPPMDA